MKCRPLGSRLLVKTIQETNYGILTLPQKVKNPSRLARVVAAGRDCREVRDGDVVMLPRYLGDPGMTGTDEVIIEEKDILMILEGFDEMADAPVPSA